MANLDRFVIIAKNGAMFHWIVVNASENKLDFPPSPRETTKRRSRSSHLCKIIYLWHLHNGLGRYWRIPFSAAPLYIPKHLHNYWQVYYP